MARGKLVVALLRRHEAIAAEATAALRGGVGDGGVRAITSAATRPSCEHNDAGRVCAAYADGREHVVSSRLPCVAVSPASAAVSAALVCCIVGTKV